MHPAWRAVLLAVAMATTVGACGGGDDDGPTLSGTSTSRPGTAAGTGSGAPVGASGSGGTGPRATAAPSTTRPPTTPSVFTTTPPGAVPGPATLSSTSLVSTAGLGALTFGLTVPAAEKAIGSRLLPDPAFTGAAQCIVLKPETGVDAVWFTVSRFTVERVDVRPPAKVGTRSGAKIGSTEAQLATLFGDRLTTTPNAQGKTVVYTPTEGANAEFRIIFELDLAGNVVSFRAGRVGVIEPLLPCT